MLYLTTCVGFGYGLMEGLFPGTSRPHRQSNKPVRLSKSVTTSWSRNIRLVPIDYAFPPRLRGRLTLRRLALRRNPWSFGESVFHTLYRYSCQILATDISRLTRGNPSQSYSTLCYRSFEPVISANGLSPVTFSPQERLTSELLRFL